MKIYDLKYDFEYDAYRYDDRLFVCAKALRRMFPGIGDRVKLALCDKKPGVKITIGRTLVVSSWWRRKEYTDFYPRFESEMSFLRRPEPYYVRIV